MPRNRPVVLAAVLTALVVLTGAAAAGIALRGRGRASPGETPALAASLSSTPAPARPAPARAEVQGALTRVFDGVMLLPAGELDALSGDFNGDGVPNLAVLVEPHPTRLAEVHAELANWKLRDALDGPAQAMARPEARVQAGERLLAMIHGNAGRGWPERDARQAHLLKNAALPRMRAQAWAALRTEAAPKPEQAGLHGDVIWSSRAGQEPSCCSGRLALCAPAPAR